VVEWGLGFDILFVGIVSNIEFLFFCVCVCVCVCVRVCVCARAPARAV
jgi:hypothetical protein